MHTVKLNAMRILQHTSCSSVFATFQANLIWGQTSQSIFWGFGKEG